MSGPLQTLLDGAPCSDPWVLDRGLQYGDGLFETLRARGGRIRFEALHRARLARGLARLDIALDAARTWQDLQRLAAAFPDSLLKLLVTRGTAVGRGYAPTGTERPRVVLTAWPAPRAADLPPRVRVVRSAVVLGENPLLAGLKHCNRLEQVLARRALAGSDAFEALQASSSGLLVSGTMSNVFLELEGELVTPVLDRCGIAGVARAVVLREAARAGLGVRVADVPWAALQRCTGLALSNARLGLLPVDDLEGRPLAVSPALRALAARIEALDD